MVDTIAKPLRVLNTLEDIYAHLPQMSVVMAEGAHASIDRAIWSAISDETRKAVTQELMLAGITPPSLKIWPHDDADAMEVPPFTTDLRVAATLMPTGWHWMLGRTAPRGRQALAYRAVAHRQDDDDVTNVRQSWGATPELALAGAAIHALWRIGAEEALDASQPRQELS